LGPEFELKPKSTDRLSTEICAPFRLSVHERGPARFLGSEKSKIFRRENEEGRMIFLFDKPSWAGLENKWTFICYPNFLSEENHEDSGEIP
jgi:hypothetical protein